MNFIKEKINLNSNISLEQVLTTTNTIAIIISIITTIINY
jgi:hypothetical protein